MQKQVFHESVLLIIVQRHRKCEKQNVSVLLKIYCCKNVHIFLLIKVSLKPAMEKVE